MCIRDRNGTSTSPCASAGTAHSGTSASPAAVVRPSRKVSRRVISFIMCSPKADHHTPAEYVCSMAADAVAIIAADVHARPCGLPLADRRAAHWTGPHAGRRRCVLLVHHRSDQRPAAVTDLSLIHISEPTRLLSISYAVFC